jgi:hypothetical protein
MARETKAKTPNYTEELTAAIVDRYTAGESVEDIAESIGKPVRSVRAKLVREGVYVAAEKPKAAVKDEGPTKKELLRELESLAPQFPIDGFVNATKEALTALIRHLETEADAPAEDPESVDEAA